MDSPLEEAGIQAEAVGDGVEHMHYEMKKAEFDQTYRDRVKNHERTNPEYTYGLKAKERSAQIEALAKLIGVPYP